MSSIAIFSASQLGIGFLSLTGVSSTGEQLTLNGVVFNLDPAGAQGTGDVGVTVANGATAAATITALVAAINANVACRMDAVDIGGDIMALMADVPGNSSLTVAETFVNGAIRAATLAEGQPSSNVFRAVGSYLVTAADVTALGQTLGTSEIPIAAFLHSLVPTTRRVVAWAERSTGVIYQLTGCILRFRNGATTLRSVLCLADGAGGPFIQAGDVIHYEAFFSIGA